jgi:hypothetical protein
MGYAVKFVESCQLPDRVHWALIRDGDDFCFVVKRDKVTPLVLEEGWSAYRRAIRMPQRPRLAAVR